MTAGGPCCPRLLEAGPAAESHSPDLQHNHKATMEVVRGIHGKVDVPQSLVVCMHVFNNFVPA